MNPQLVLTQVCIPLACLLVHKCLWFLPLIYTEHKVSRNLASSGVVTHPFSNPEYTIITLSSSQVFPIWVSPPLRIGFQVLFKGYPSDLP
uniref:Uncharacterized protein n=1 Tax=Salix viminalis TaxID=40686 RepID=A0A6N2KKQ3_SALVM